jgi:UDP-N-acetylmuramoyl-tripeptide--D-alanyl-D-alanine ligase
MLANIKKYLKRFSISVYSPAVRRFLSKNSQTRLIGVSGSVGKTSTKFAIKSALEAGGKKVLVHDGAFNDPLASIFVVLHEEYPNVQSPPSMLKAFFRIRKAAKAAVDYDYIVLELGTDMPGEMAQFGKFLKLDMCVVSAITPEHMVNFKSFDDVAKEEIEILRYSDSVVVNGDLVPKKYQRSFTDSGKKVSWFGTSKSGDAVIRAGGLMDVGLKTKREIRVRIDGVETQIKSSLLHLHSGFVMGAALLVAKECGVSVVAAARGLEDMEVAAGRGRLLAGKKGSIIIDDSYNNVGANVSIASLDLLYEFNTRRRIAVLGGINEMSQDIEQEAHTEVALHLKDKKLEEVVLIGTLAKKYYKPILATSGTPFKWFSNPYKAGNYLQNKLVAGMVVLVKGSQNGIYSEEAIKPLLQDTKDEALLVRQSKSWILKKKKSFGL